MKMKLPWEENETTTIKRHVIGECNWLQITLGAWTVITLTQGIPVILNLELYLIIYANPSIWFSL